MGLSMHGTGHDDIKHYGGFLIAESILNRDDAKLIAIAPDMLRFLQEEKEWLTACIELEVMSLEYLNNRISSIDSILSNL